MKEGTKEFYAPIKQFFKNSDYALVINWKFHEKNKWVCAQTPYLVNAIIKQFDPLIISSQVEYEIHKKKIKYIVSMEPGWAAPKISYDKKQKHTIGVFVSDPHNKTDWFEDYVYENDIDYVFSYYYHPFLHHFPQFDKSRLIHMPWAVPDEFVIDPESITYNNQQKIHIFGGTKGEAYELRNWCRKFSFVDDHRNSGCENKIMSDEEYFKWGQQFDAVIAAGSISEKYQLVTPKYFEIAAAGSLLFAQYCKDLDLLGFNENNCVIFDRENFEEKVVDYLENPAKYFNKRKLGCSLITERHKISDRISLMRELIGGKGDWSI